jgi:hypothetical protein
MMTSKTLADTARHITILEIRCSRCDLSGRMNVAKLIDQYGAGMPLPDLGTMLVADYDNAQAHDYARCDVFYPQLKEIFDNVI